MDVNMSTNPHNLNTGMRCVKYMLLIINFLFMLTSVMLILVGTTIQAIFGDFRVFVDDHFFSPSAILIAVGGIMLVVSTFGCIGAVKESTMLINVYGVCLFLVFFLEIGAAIGAFMLQKEVRPMLARSMDHSMSHYYNNTDFHQGVDFMQSQLECCGVYNRKDWEFNYNPNKLQNKTVYLSIYPESCCSEKLPDKCARYYDHGCLNRMTFLISQSAMLIATGATTVAFVQLLGVMSAFMLAKTIRRNKSIREARRWQLQQSLGILVTGGKSLQEPGYTQLHKATTPEPVTYTANSPSVN